MSVFSVEQARIKIDSYSAHADIILLMFNLFYDVPFSDYKRAIGKIAENSNLPILWSQRVFQKAGNYLFFNLHIVSIANNLLSIC